MAAGGLKKGTEDYMMFEEFWNLCKKYWIPEQSDAYWEAVAEDFSKFHKKYNTPYSKHFALAALNALDEVAGRGEKSV